MDIEKDLMQGCAARKLLERRGGGAHPMDRTSLIWCPDFEGRQDKDWHNYVTGGA
jgi:hypothetical protein